MRHCGGERTFMRLSELARPTCVCDTASQLVLDQPHQPVSCAHLLVPTCCDCVDCEFLPLACPRVCRAHFIASSTGAVHLGALQPAHVLALPHSPHRALLHLPIGSDTLARARTGLVVVDVGVRRRPVLDRICIRVSPSDSDPRVLWLQQDAGDCARELALLDAALARA